MVGFSFMHRLLDRIAEQGRKLVSSSNDLEMGQQDMETLCMALLSERAEASGIALAINAHEAYHGLGSEEKFEFFEKLALEFGANHAEIETAISRYLDDPTSANASKLHAVAEPQRQELIRRLNRAPHGTAQLVRMREDLLPLLKRSSSLEEVDLDFHHLLSSWFNPGFLVLDRIDWNTPAAILEKIIRYEAVHEIQSWDDLRRRIEPSDRCCYAYFHPTLVDEPLIFVEVALTQDIPAAIQPILSQDRVVLDQRDATTAVFYSISNCQAGLRGISFGNFLIKRVVEELKRDLPQLETFVTLSPVPTFRRWLSRITEGDEEVVIGTEKANLLRKLDQPNWPQDARTVSQLEATIMPLAAHYFLNAKTKDGAPIDPVARFHLGNGARLQRINWLGDLSERGLRQAAGLMVNYLYDLNHIEDNHELFVHQRAVVASSAVKRLLPEVPFSMARTATDQQDI